LADLPLDQSDGGIERRFYIQVGGIEQYGVFGGPHRCARAIGVALVALTYHFQHFFVSYIVALRLAFKITPPGTDLGQSGHEYFDIRVGTYHGADIPPVEHGSRLAPRELALKVQQRLSDPLDASHN